MNVTNTNFLLSLIINLFDVGVILRFFDKVLEPIENRNVLKRCLGLLLVIPFTFLSRNEFEYCNIVSIAAWCCFFLVFYKGVLKNKIFYIILLVMFAGFSQMLMYLVNVWSVNDLYTFFIPHLCFCVIMEAISRLKTINTKRINIRILLLLLSVPLISFASMPSLVLISERMSIIPIQNEMTLLVPFVILILYMNFIVFYLYDLISSSYEVKRQKEEFEQLIVWQRQYYETLSDNQNIIRKIKHDMQNNLHVVYNFLCEKKYEDAQDYLQSMIDEQSEINKFVTTGNDSIDTVLNIKFSFAEQHGITVNKDINIPSKIPITYQDSIKIFGNLLDNAINALKDEEVTEKWISWFMFYNANVLIIQVSNPYTGKPVKYNKDTFWHGLGLDIVRATVDDYDGTFEIVDDGCIFSVNILLYIDNYMEKGK